MSKYTRYAFIFLGAVLLLWMAAVVGVHAHRYWLDPLYFLDHDSRFVCLHAIPNVIILAAVLAAFAGLAYELRRVRKDRTISTSIYVICLALLLLTTGSFLFWFTVGVGFICGGG